MQDLDLYRVIMNDTIAYLDSFVFNPDSVEKVELSIRNHEINVFVLINEIPKSYTGFYKTTNKTQHRAIPEGTIATGTYRLETTVNCPVELTDGLPEALMKYVLGVKDNPSKLLTGVSYIKTNGVRSSLSQLKQEMSSLSDMLRGEADLIKPYKEKLDLLSVIRSKYKN